MKVIVTGSSGFIGAHLVAHLAVKGYEVMAMQRREPKALPMGVEFQKFDLASTLDDSKFEGADYLIHTAYQPYSRKNKNADEVNRTGTQQLIEACKKHGIRMIFLSTMSAHEGAESHYGKSKLELESFFDRSKHLVLKLGLVLGSGGLFYKIVDTVRESTFVPVAAGDKPIQTIALTDMFAMLEIAMEKQIVGKYAVGESDPTTLKNLYKTIADAVPTQPFFIPAPVGLIYFVCSVAEIFRITLPVTTENVLGLKQLIAFDTKSTLAAFDYPLPSYDKVIPNLQIPSLYDSKPLN